MILGKNLGNVVHREASTHIHRGRNLANPLALHTEHSIPIVYSIRKPPKLSTTAAAHISYLRYISTMKLLVKTLKGGKFEVQVEETNTVAQVKGIIVRD
jgi:hypothetical protein